MANFEIKVTDHSGEVIKVLNERIHDALYLMGLQAEREAKLNLEHDPRRIDTGMLRNSITFALGGEGPQITSYKGDNPSRYKGDGKIPSGGYVGTTPEGKVPCVYVGTNVEYAPEVHYGTERMRPNYFLRDAVLGHEDTYRQIADRVFHYGST